MKNKLVLGITGKSGCGKTTFVNNLAGDYYTIDVDIIHKEIVAELRDPIVGIYIEMEYPVLEFDEAIKIFFKDKELREQINALTFPILFERIKKLVDESANDVIILDAPLLFDTQLNKLCNKFWLVKCNTSDNIKRLIERNKLSHEDAIWRYNVINFTSEQYKLFEQIINTSIPYKVDYYKKMIEGYGQE